MGYRPRRSWRRSTRPPTLLAVPTTTAVVTAARATGRRRNMCSLLRLVGSTRLGPSDMAGSIRSCGIRDPSSEHAAGPRIASTNGVAQVSSQMSSAADVLGSRPSAAYSMSSSLMSPPTSPSRSANPRQLLVLVELDRDDVAVGVLGDEHQVEEADRAALDQLGELGSDLAVELVAGEPDDDVLDRSDRHTPASAVLVACAAALELKLCIGR